MPFASPKLLSLLSHEGPLASAVAGVWGERGAILCRQLDAPPEALAPLGVECVDVLRHWARPDVDEGVPTLSGWLLGLRQDLSLEAVARVLMQLDHTLREAAWVLGLPGPDWQALGDLMAAFFEAALDEAVAGARGRHQEAARMREELAFLRRLTRALEEEDGPQRLMQLAVRETAHLLDCEFCAVLLPSEEDRRVLIVAAAEAPALLRSAVSGLTFPLDGPGLVAQVVMSGAPASTSDPLADLDITLRRRQTLEGLGFGHMTAHPLASRGRVVGVLVLANRLSDEPWSSADDDWIGTLASHLAAAVVLARAGGSMQAREREATAWLDTLASLVEPGLAEHGRGVAALAGDLAEQLGLGPTRVQSIRDAALVHDVGQVFWPEVLRRRPGPLWPEEIPIVHSHPQRAATLLEGIPALAHLAPAVLAHHERWDGTGYPQGLSGDRIPLEARLIAVADAFVSLTTPQVYQEALPARAAHLRIREAAGTQFDPMIVDALSNVVGVPGDTTPHEGQDAGRRLEPRGPNLPALASRLIATIHNLASQARSTPFPLSFWGALREQCPFDGALLWLRDADGELRLREAPALSAAPLGVQAGPQSVEAHAATWQVPVAMTHPTADPRFTLPAWLVAARIEGIVALPLVQADRVVGVMTLVRRGAAPFTGVELAVAELGAALAAQGLRQGFSPQPEETPR